MNFAGILILCWMLGPPIFFYCGVTSARAMSSKKSIWIVLWFILVLGSGAAIMSLPVLGAKALELGVIQHHPANQ